MVALMSKVLSNGDGEEGWDVSVNICHNTFVNLHEVFRSCQSL